MTEAATEVNDNINPTQIEAIPVSIDPEDLAVIRSAAEFSPVFAAWQTIILNGVAADLQPQQILQADLKRIRAYLQVRATGGTPLQSEGSVTSPGANVAIVNVAVGSLTPGWYTVNWAVELDGTVSATDVDNFILKGPGLGTGLTSINDGVVGRYQQNPVQIYISSTNATALSIRSVAAGTVGAVYSAQLSLVPVVNPVGFVTVGQIGQVSNGQGGRIYTGDSRWEIRAHSPLWLTGDGITAMNITVFVERDQGM